MLNESIICDTCHDHTAVRVIDGANLCGTCAYISQRKAA